MRVVEIFKSIDGEGIRAGYPVTFIRLAGCNLRCSYCDTKYSYDSLIYKNETIYDIMEEVDKLGCNRITLTGGEPLIHNNVQELIETLTDNNYEVNIETNGSVDIKKYTKNKNVIITMDYKCPSSGMEDKMLLKNLSSLRTKDVLKFVVGSKEDLNKCKQIIKDTKAQVFISPVFGNIEPKEIVKYILDNNMYNCRVQLQLHKFIWNPEERGV